MPQMEMTIKHKQILMGIQNIIIVKTDSWTDNNGNSKVDIGDLITYTITVSIQETRIFIFYNSLNIFTTSLDETLILTTPAK